MISDLQIPEPFLFNPIKHHLGFIREFINSNIENQDVDIHELTRFIKHVGTSVMDIYTGSISIRNICSETEEFLKKRDIFNRETYSGWTGTKSDCFRIITLSDGSHWTLKYHNNSQRFVHIFPARNQCREDSQVFPTLRTKSNTLKSALIYIILDGKDMVTEDDLNKVRPFLGLSPVKNAVDIKAILQMIEILRS